jgi:phage terminase large subunit-like protein
LASAWDNLQIATRLGRNPQVFVATTPRRVPAVIELFERAISDPASIDLIRGSTKANRHLSASYHATLDGLYAGTSVARQELDGELLMDVDGAIWSTEMIDDHRDHSPPNIMKLPLRAIGVDPSVAERPRDECGIVVVGASGERQLHQRQAWIYQDHSFLADPKSWADRVVELARGYNAVVVVERNQGGQLVKNTLKGIDPTIPVVDVWAKQGKRIRAEPVALAYQQGRVHHTDYFGLLEDQMTTWDSETSTRSPDRMDALVWALHALLVKTPDGWAGEIRAAMATARNTTVPGVRATDSRPRPFVPDTTPRQRAAALGRRRFTKKTAQVPLNRKIGGPY